MLPSKLVRIDHPTQICESASVQLEAKKQAGEENQVLPDAL